MLNQENLPKENPPKMYVVEQHKPHKNMRTRVKIADVVKEGWINTGRQITALRDDIYHLIVSHLLSSTRRKTIITRIRRRQSNTIRNL